MSANKILFFKVSSCKQCQLQEDTLKKSSIDYIPCELFKNRQLARKYMVTDVPTIIIIDENNTLLAKYDFFVTKEIIKKIKGFVK